MLPPGTKLANGRYELKSTLGSGGFAITYRGRDTKLERDVAIKELFLPQFSREGMTVNVGTLSFKEVATVKKRFIEEARTLAQFSHRNIVRVLDYFKQHNTTYIVMELLVGETLEEYLEHNGPLDPERAMSLAKTLCEALTFVHSAGLLHRDIKPSNIFVTESERAVLIDFGAAKVYHQSRTLQQPQLLTPAYAAPEQLRGDTRLGAFTDLYALSVTLYRAVSGALPPSALERLAGVALPKLPPQLPQRLEQSIERGLELDPGKRWQDASEFATALESDITIVTPDQDLAAAIRQAPPGSILRLERGDYTLTQTLRIDKSLTLTGEGSDQTSITGTARGPLIDITHGHTVRLRHLAVERVDIEPGNVIEVSCDVFEGIGCYISGGVAEPGGDGCGIRFQHHCQAVLQQCEVVGNQTCGIILEDRAKGSLLRNIVRGNGMNGITFRGHAQGVARKNLCEHNDKYGVAVLSRNAPLLDANTCRGNKRAGICFTGSALSAANNNLCEANLGPGIVVLQQAKPKLEQNICRSNSASGIIYHEDAGGLALENSCEQNVESGIVVAGHARPKLVSNSCCDNGETGIVYNGSASGEATGNICDENRTDGISVTDRAAPTLTQNSCNYNARAGIGFDHNASGRVEDNICQYSEANGIRVGGFAQPELVNNLCRYNAQSGIIYIGGASGIARDNRCGKNGGDGVTVTERAGPTLTANLVQENGGSGLVYRGQATGVALGNTCAQNQRHGIVVDDVAFPRLERNLAHRNGDSGIVYGGASNSVLQQNTCEENTVYGLKLTNGAAPRLRGNTVRNNGIDQIEGKRRWWPF